MDLDDDLELAHQLARASARIARDLFQKPLRVQFKVDGTPVTNADVAVEDQLRAILTEKRPADTVTGEEGGTSGPDSTRHWLLDGIDGTLSFIEGKRDWSTLIALVVDDQVVLGIASQPLENRTYWAARGHGAHRTASDGSHSAPLRVSSVASLRNARSFVWQDEGHDIVDRLAALTTFTMTSDHSALLVATGDLDVAVFASRAIAPWDIAAPSILVEEAGGQFSDGEGNRTIASRLTFFTNGVLHGDVLRAAVDT